MFRTTLNAALLAVSMISVVSISSSASAGTVKLCPKAVCAAKVLKQYGDSKNASLTCLEQLEADIAEGNETGLPLSPPVILSRTTQCQNLEMTATQLKAALLACSKLR